MKVWELIELLKLQCPDLEVVTLLTPRSWIGEESRGSHGPLWVGQVDGKVRVGMDCSLKTDDQYRTSLEGQIVTVGEYYRRGGNR